MLLDSIVKTHRQTLRKTGYYENLRPDIARQGLMEISGQTLIDRAL
jgi:hypothetical protein